MPQGNPFIQVRVPQEWYLALGEVVADLSMQTETKWTRSELLRVAIRQFLERAGYELPEPRGEE